MSLKSDKEIFKIHAQFCSAIANETRLQIIWLLQKQEYCVSELAEELEITVPNTSQHLKILKDQGAVTGRKDGQQVYYKITNKKFVEGYKLIREGIIEIHRSKDKVFMAN